MLRSGLLSVFKQDNRTRRSSSSATGAVGEEIATRYIAAKGLRLVMANFKAPIGRNSRGAIVTGEIDLIALDGNTLCFIEVKTRRSRDFGGPLTAVDLRKQRQITRIARVYRKVFRLSSIRQRFDVVTVLLEHKREPEIEHVKGFWTENKFGKRRWHDEIP